MKQIPRIPLDGASILTPTEMNSIHFETGLHSPAGAGGSDRKPSSASKPQ